MAGYELKEQSAVPKMTTSRGVSPGDSGAAKPPC